MLNKWPSTAFHSLSFERPGSLKDIEFLERERETKHGKYHPFSLQSLETHRPHERIAVLQCPVVDAPSPSGQPAYAAFHWLLKLQSALALCLRLTFISESRELRGPCHCVSASGRLGLPRALPVWPASSLQPTHDTHHPHLAPLHPPVPAEAFNLTYTHRSLK